MPLLLFHFEKSEVQQQMSTMRVKNKDGSWDKIPVLGSYQAVIAANAAAVNAQNAATHAEVQAASVKKYKALWFDSVAAMKAEQSLTAGAYVCTAGYYEPNDGGGASYLIRAKLESDVADGGSLHELANGLVAELIIENGTVRPEQFGAKGDCNYLEHIRNKWYRNISVLNAENAPYYDNVNQKWYVNATFGAWSPYYDNVDKKHYLTAAYSNVAKYYNNITDKWYINASFSQECKYYNNVDGKWYYSGIFNTQCTFIGTDGKYYADEALTVPYQYYDNVNDKYYVNAAYCLKAKYYDNIEDKYYVSATFNNECPYYNSADNKWYANASFSTECPYQNNITGHWYASAEYTNEANWFDEMNNQWYANATFDTESTDDTESIIKAINFADIVVFKKNYLVSESIILNNKYVLGCGSTIVSTNNEGTDGVFIPNKSSIDGLTIIGKNGISLNSDEITRNIYISNINFKCEGYCFYVMGVFDGVTIKDCKFTSPCTKNQINIYGFKHISTETGGITDDIYYNPCKNLVIENCNFIKASNAKHQFGDGRVLGLYNVVNIKCSNLNAINLYPYHKDGTADLFEFDLCRNVVIENITNDWSGENGIDILSCKNVSITGCDIKYCEDAAIAIAPSDMVYVFGSSMSDPHNLICENISITNSAIEGFQSITLNSCDGFNMHNCNIISLGEYVLNTAETIEEASDAWNNAILLDNIFITNNKYKVKQNGNIFRRPGKNVVWKNGWDTNIELDEELAFTHDYVINTTNVVSDKSRVMWDNVYFPFKNFKAELFYNSRFYDVTGYRELFDSSNNFIGRGGIEQVGKDLENTSEGFFYQMAYCEFLDNNMYNYYYNMPSKIKAGMIRVKFY